MNLKQQQKERIKCLGKISFIVLLVSLFSFLIAFIYIAPYSMVVSGYLLYSTHVDHMIPFPMQLGPLLWIILSFLPILGTFFGLATIPPGLYQKIIKKVMQNWMNRYGICVFAEVVKQNIWTVEHAEGRTTSYHLSLKWQDMHTGKEYSFDQRVPRKKLYPLGSPVRIQFDPDDPSFYIVDMSLPLRMWGDCIHLG